MTEPFYALHQLAELQEGYYGVNRTNNCWGNICL
jgi:hypothetical protein